METKKRSIVKTFSWRIVATLTTIALVYLFTGQIRTAFEIGALEVILKLLFYYLHERVWSRITWQITTD